MSSDYLIKLVPLLSVIIRLCVCVYNNLRELWLTKRMDNTKEKADDHPKKTTDKQGKDSQH